jgi:hypothetical protein
VKRVSAKAVQCGGDVARPYFHSAEEFVFLNKTVACIGFIKVLH